MGKVLSEDELNTKAEAERAADAKKPLKSTVQALHRDQDKAEIARLQGLIREMPEYKAVLSADENKDPMAHMQAESKFRTAFFQLMQEKPMKNGAPFKLELGKSIVEGKLLDGDPDKDPPLPADPTRYSALKFWRDANSEIKAAKSAAQEVGKTSGAIQTETGSAPSAVPTVKELRTR